MPSGPDPAVRFRRLLDMEPVLIFSNSRSADALLERLNRLWPLFVQSHDE